MRIAIMAGGEERMRGVQIYILRSFMRIAIMAGGEERMRGVQIYILRSFMRIAIMDGGGEERMRRGSRFIYLGHS